MSNVNDPEILRVAEKQKRRRFVPRGIVSLVVGIVLLAIGMFLNTGIRSLEGFLIGVGLLAIIIGIIMILIGLINPLIPDQINQ